MVRSIVSWKLIGAPPVVFAFPCAELAPGAGFDDGGCDGVEDEPAAAAAPDGGVGDSAASASSFTKVSNCSCSSD